MVFFLIIAIVIIGRTMVGNHFKKKFSKRPPPGIIVTEVVKKEFSEKIETFGTAISKKSKTFKIKKDDLFEDLNLKSFVKKGETLIELKSGNIIAPFSGVLGYTGLTEDILVSNNIVIITLDDNSVIYSDIKIPENYSASIKKGLPVEVKLTSYKDKIFAGEVDFVSSRINADTRSLLSRIKVENEDLELISGSLLEVVVKFDLRNSLSVPDTSVMIEGDKSYVYKINEENINDIYYDIDALFNTKSDIEKLVDALVYHYPKALEETGSSLDRVHNAFRMKEPLKVLKKESIFSNGLKVQLERSILQVDKNEWDSFFAGQGCFDWEALRFLEGAFTDNDPVPENNWKFYYLIIRDAKKRPVLVTFFTLSLWKDDMLAPASISIETERKRIKDPYYLTSKVLSMGSLFTEGDHLYLDRSNPSWNEALSIMIRELEKLEMMSEPGMMVLRDFTEDDELNAILHGQGFIKASMPEACIYSDFSWETMEGYVASLSSRSRRHFNNDIKPYQEKFDIYIKKGNKTK